MKIILSRKGFDSSYGEIPSPVLKLKDGSYKIVSLPIPSDQDKSDIQFSKLPLADKSSMLDFILENNSKFYEKFTDHCHLDPDILFETNPTRDTNWCPAFGQDDIAQSVLLNNNVTSGDIFLFFGWFQFAELINETFKFSKNNEYPNGFHMLFGYLKIDQSFEIKTHCPNELKYHPHYKFHNNYRLKSQNNNTIYKAAKYLDNEQNLKGANIFKYSKKLILTKPNEGRRTIWKLPSFFSLDNGVRMSYHLKPERWSKENNSSILKSVAKGQEFVVFNDPDTKVLKWGLEIIKSHSI